MKRLLITLMLSAVVTSGIVGIAAGATNSAQAMSIAYKPIWQATACSQQTIITVSKPWAGPAIERLDSLMRVDEPVADEPVWDKLCEYEPMVDPQINTVTSGPVHIEQDEIVINGSVQFG